MGAGQSSHSGRLNSKLETFIILFLSIMSSNLRLLANCAATVLLAFAVMQIVGIVEAYVLIWTGGGMPSFFVSIGWGNATTFFVYDTVRFCLISFLAVWPVTFLKPQKPVLYSMAIIIAMIIWHQYWRHLFGWTSLPQRAQWVPWLALVRVLSIPAMYQLHVMLKARHNGSLNKDTSDVCAEIKTGKF